MLSKVGQYSKCSLSWVYPQEPWWPSTEYRMAPLQMKASNPLRDYSRRVCFCLGYQAPSSLHQRAPDILLAEAVSSSSYRNFWIEQTWRLMFSEAVTVTWEGWQGSMGDNGRKIKIYYKHVWNCQVAKLANKKQVVEMRGLRMEGGHASKHRPEVPAYPEAKTEQLCKILSQEGRKKVKHSGAHYQW